MHDSSRLLWIDLEMTGLDPQKDVILEIASLVTTPQLEIVAQGPHAIIHQPDSLLSNMDVWSKEQHQKSGLSDSVKKSTTTLQEAYENTLHFIKKQCPEKKTLLAGNSIWQDRLFLQRYMPDIISWLHYRLIDVSTLKELVKQWYPQDPHNNFVKKETHRALDDIKESIEELNYYKKYFFK